MFFQQNNEEAETKKIFVESELLVTAVQEFKVPLELNFDGMSKEEVYQLLINQYPGENDNIFTYRMGTIDVTINIEFLGFDCFREVTYNETVGDVMRTLNLD